MEVTGKLLVIGDVATFGEKKWPKREIVVETQDSYPNGKPNNQKISIELGGDKTVLTDVYNIGDSVTVFCNLKGREWTDPKTGSVRYFNTISGWKIDSATPTQVQGNVPQQVATDGDLPF